MLLSCLCNLWMWNLRHLDKEIKGQQRYFQAAIFARNCSHDSSTDDDAVSCFVVRTQFIEALSKSCSHEWVGIRVYAGFVLDLRYVQCLEDRRTCAYRHRKNSVWNSIAAHATRIALFFRFMVVNLVAVNRKLFYMDAVPSIYAYW